MKRTRGLIIAVVLLAPVVWLGSPRAQESAKKWDITAPLGPTTTVEFDTAEGTWMNVDVSPDGERIVFDLTPGQSFEYNKDPNGTIYAIVRRDLTDGREERAVSVQGGSVAPRLSPDGRTLAYVRRVRLGSHLFLRDLDTGRDRPVFDRLDKDLQEAWAVHGVYPQYAWTPDGRSIVIWGQGKIWRVGVTGDSATATEVPFTVRVEQTINEALRFKQAVHPDEFPVRMLRDVTTSPDGKAVTYNALGHVSVKSLPDGEPRRLTGAGEFEFDPAFSPDGQWLVYRSTPADGLRGVDYGEHPGIYVVPADGGAEPRLVTREGSEPQFDHTGARIYLRARRNDKFALYSVDLNGGKEIVHLQSDNAMQVVPSPDGRWIAFEERFNVYIAPFPQTGRPIVFGPDQKAYPTARVSRETGWNLHWSGDSWTVYWSLGPELFSRDLGRTFAFFDRSAQPPPGQPFTPDEPETRGVPIGFTAKADKPARGSSRPARSSTAPRRRSRRSSRRTRTRSRTCAGRRRPAHQRVGERAPAEVRAARHRGRAVAPPPDGTGGRLQPRAHREGRQGRGRRRWHGADGRARPAPGARRALGDLDDGAGRHGADRGAGHGHLRRRLVPGS